MSALPVQTPKIGWQAGVLCYTEALSERDYSIKGVDIVGCIGQLCCCWCPSQNLVPLSNQLILRGSEPHYDIAGLMCVLLYLPLYKLFPRPATSLNLASPLALVHNWYP